jgi:hypothetical protein
MKKYIFALLLCAGFALPALGQSNPPLRLQEIDGTPNVLGVTTIKVTNGTLSCSGKVCTITISGGGGGSPGGSNTQVQYNAAGSFGGAAGFTFNGTSTISLGVAGSSVGAIGFRNATSGTITLQPVAGALGTSTLSLPAVTDTLVGLAATQTLTNKTLTTPVIGDFSNANHNHSNSAGGGQIAISSGISGLGTGVATALGVNVGSAGAPVLFNGAGGTPSSLTLTNATGLPPTTGISGWPANASGVLTNNGAGVLSWAAAGGGITIGTTTITSGTNTRVLYNNAGVVGEYTVTGTAGNVVLSASPTLTGTVAMAAQTNSGTIVQTSASATAFESGPNGSTNPVFRLVNNTASQADGLSITGLAAGNGVTLQALSSGANTPINITAKGSGNIALSNSVASLTINVSQNSILGAPVFIGSGIRMANSQSVAFSNGTDFGRGLTGITGGVRVNQGESSSTGQGNFLITNSSGSVGTSGVGVLVMQNGTAPSSSPADEFQLYSADSAAGDANAYARNEAGEINRLTGLSARNSSSFAKTSDTTLANITGLTRNVEAGRTYYFETELSITSVSTGGVKFAISGTATATSINYEGVLRDGTTISAATRATALDTTVCAVTAVTAATCRIRGVVVVANAGTLTVRFAQNASDGSASTVLVNQALTLAPIS